MMSTEDSAVRVATVLSAAMNVAAVLNHEPALVAEDPAELKSTLLWIADEMSWIVADVAGAGKSSLTLPPDAQDRIDRFRLAVNAWDPIGPLPSGVAICSQVCLGMLVPV